MDDFRKLVKNMREKQKEYFKTGNRMVLDECKKFESLVDIEVSQQSLFEGENE